MSENVLGRPNVLLVIVDDMSAFQLGCYGNEYFETPHLDAFARQGVRCSRSYATSPVCSPARASIYTGRHPARLHLTNYMPGTVPDNPRLITPEWQNGLPVSEYSYGRVFKEAGYETAHFGKWHLAEDYHYEPNREMDPESHGFEEVFVTKKPKADADPEEDAHNVEKLTRKTIEFLEGSHDRPFFCVLAHNAIHRPEMAPARLVEKFESKSARNGDWRHPMLAAMTSQVDDSFGRLMDTLDETRLTDNTIIVFTADHGAMSRSEELKPWRGSKADLYEAGLRVPLLIRFPERIARDYELSNAVSLADLFPTLLDLAGVASPDVELDGVSLTPWLRRERADAPADALYWHFPHYHHLGLAPCGAMTKGRFKLIEWFDASIGGSRELPSYELFDLEADPGEQRNLADEMPDVRDELALALRKWRRRVGAQEMTVNACFNPSAGGQRSEPPLGDEEMKAVL